jgi:CubicO group peptidase (beta-lactamase class C family)
MRRSVFQTVLILLLVAALQSSTGLPVPAKDPLKGIDAYILKAMKDWELPGLAVAVVKDDKVVMAKGYGLKEVGKNEPVDENTLFAIGSNSKAFTATALALLVQDKKLSWEDPVTNYLKGFQLFDPYVTREIMVRDLLCHRSGLGRRGDALWYGQDFSRDEILRRIRFLKPNSSFRSQYGYQNIMFLAAGQIIPSVAGVSWDDFIKERIFKPLGMNRSNTSTKDLPAVDNVAAPHTKRDGKVVAIPYRNIDNVAPAGSINSSVMEMAQWHRFQLGNGKYGEKQILDPAILQVTHDPHITIPVRPERKKEFPSNHFSAYGLGWVLEDYRGRLIIWHNGGIDGMLSHQGFLPEENLGIVVLTNSDRNRLDAALFYRIVDTFLGEPVKDWSQTFLAEAKEGEAKAEEARKKSEESRVRNTKPSLEVPGYCGTYENEMYGTAEVKSEAGKLILYFNSKPMGVLDHWHYDTFKVKAEALGSLRFLELLEDSLVTFALNAQGKVAKMEIEELAVFDRSPEPQEKEN